MPERITVYCRRPDVRVDAAELRAALELADLETLAEALELPEGEEAAVAAMWPHQRLARRGGMLEISWRESGRPIQVDVVRGEQARGEAEELVAVGLPAAPDEHAGARRVRRHLAQTRSVVSFEMGINDAHDLAATIGEVLAFHLAEQGDGLVWFYRRAWAAPDDRSADIGTTQ